MYGVPISLEKLPKIKQLSEEKNIKVHLFVDNQSTLSGISKFARQHKLKMSVFLCIDSGYGCERFSTFLPSSDASHEVLCLCLILSWDPIVGEKVFQLSRKDLSPWPSKSPKTLSCSLKGYTSMQATLMNARDGKRSKRCQTQSVMWQPPLQRGSKRRGST